MNRLLKITILTAAVAATTLTALIPADAHDRWHHGYRRHSDGGDLVAAGVLGLAVGAIAAGVLADDPPYRPYYVEPEPSVVYYQDQAQLEPWSPEWFRYCGDRYRSFNPDTGTFVGYDGDEHFCVAN